MKFVFTIIFYMANTFICIVLLLLSGAEIRFKIGSTEYFLGSRKD